MQDTVQDFLKFIEAEKSYAENTIAAYRNDLTQFVSYVEKKVSGNWQAVNKETIDQYINFLKHEQEKPRKRRRLYPGSGRAPLQREDARGAARHRRPHQQRDPRRQRYRDHMQ